MQSARLPLRASCFAQNAYHAHNAIAATFSSALYQSSGSTVNRPRFSNPIAQSQWLSRHPHRFLRRVSTGSAKKASASPLQDTAVQALELDGHNFKPRPRRVRSTASKDATAKEQDGAAQQDAGDNRGLETSGSPVNTPPQWKGKGIVRLAPRPRDRILRVRTGTLRASRSSTDPSTESQGELKSKILRIRPATRVKSEPTGGMSAESQSRAKLSSLASRDHSRSGRKSKHTDVVADRYETSDWRAEMGEIAIAAHALSEESPKDSSDPKAVLELQKALDYRAQVIPLLSSPATQSAPIPWALSREEAAGYSPSEKLELEIHRFVNHMEPTAAERAARAAVIPEINDLFKQTAYSGCIVGNVYGSEMTGLAMGTSDIDILITYVDSTGHSHPRRLIAPSRKVFEALQNSEDYVCVTHRMARFPIINAMHKATAIDVQIVSAPPTTAQQDATLRLLTDLPHLRPLYFLMRTAFGARGLLDVINGGIGSYGLLMMLAASLNRREAERSAGTRAPTMAAELDRFLAFYAHLDREQSGVGVSPPRLFNKTDADKQSVLEAIETARGDGDLVLAGQHGIAQRRPHQPYLLCLQDPADPTNDLGRKTNAIKHLVATMASMRQDLKEGLERAAGEDAEPSSLLLPLVGRCHEVNAVRRKKAEEYGLKVLAARAERGGVGMEDREAAAAAAV